ncbi:MAG: PAS domain S-box protein [Acidobacteria bacterium]|nr:PAS domain S-box protein [Acidobacteriota bacterium]
MARLPVRVKIILASVVSAVVLCLAVANLTNRMEWKEISDGVAWTGAWEGISARRLQADGPGGQAGIAPGDVLLGINGQRVRDLDDYYRLLDRVRPGSEAVYLVRKAGKSAQISYLLLPRLSGGITRTDLYLALVAIVYLTVGLGIFLRNWRAEFSFHFFLVSLFSFVLYLFRYTGKADTFDIFVYWLSTGALLLLPAVFFHFCLNFPARNRLVARKPLLTAAYTSAAVLLGIHAFWFAGAMRVMGVPRNLVFKAVFDRLHLIYFTFWFCAAAAVLAYSRLRCQSVEQRQQLKWIVRATVLAVMPFTLCYALPFTAGFVPGSLQEMSILSLAVLPLGFGYAILKYKLMDVDVIFKRGAAYFMASAALLALYFALALVAGKLVLVYAPDAGLGLFAFAALLTAFLFNPLRNRIQRTLDRFFYMERYDYRTSLAEFSRTLSSEVSLDRLAAMLLHRIQKTMNVPEVALLIRQEGDRYALRDALNVRTDARFFHVPESVLDNCDRELKPRYLSSGDDAAGPVRGILHQAGLYYLQPLRAHDRVIALLALGRRRGGDWLSTEDLELLQVISGYAAIAIENAGLYQKVESKARELEQLKVFSESIVESIQVGVLTLDAQGKITSLNTGMEALADCSRNNCVGKPASALFPESVLEQVHASSGGHWVVMEAMHFYKVTLQTPGGQTRIVNLHFTPFVSRNDIITGTLVVVDDVTQKVRLEDQLVQAEKLTSLGLLAAGIAHEVNTPLAGISSYTQMLLKELPGGHPHRPVLKKMEEQTFRASEIVNNLLNFARLSGGDFRQVNLNHLVTETLSLLDHQLKRQNIQVSTDLDPGLPSTYGIDGKLQQVLMNLFLNAKDAMPEGGRIQVRTAMRDNVVEIAIRDTGAGIPREHIKRIYDPFFTTKEVGRGTGLGLSISYGIIQEHSGNIHVESEPGKGTKFTLHFPVRRIH